MRDHFGTARIASSVGVRMPTEAPRGERADDDGTGGVFVTIPIRTVNVTNAREHYMTRHRRTKREHEAVWAALLSHKSKIRGTAWRVTLTRISPGTLDKSNLPAALKGIEDAVAQFLLGGKPGQYDDDPRLTWERQQASLGRGVHGVTIRIEAAHNVR